MTREKASKKFLKFPVVKNGVYFNADTNRLEFWFVFKGRKAQVGECKIDLPDQLSESWENNARSQIRELLEKTFGKNLAGLTPK